jgi:Protein of unknown function (DUF3071)
MRDVKLVRLSDDGTHLVLTHEGTGEEFALRVDDRLRGAVVSDRARQGSLPLERQSRLRPKEIQARLRAGESSEDIAAAADVPIERILRYAGPVLAEREYIAEQARRCALRRNGRDGPGQILDDAVGTRLDELQVDRELASWDAWRSSEGRWVIAVSFTLRGTDYRALFGYDPLGRVVTASDDKARTLIGEASPPIPGLTPELAPGFVSDRPSRADGAGGTPRTARDQRLRLAPAPAVDDGFGPGDLPDAEETIDLSQTLGQPRRQSGTPAAQASGHQSRGNGRPAPPDELAPDEVPDLDDPPQSPEPDQIAQTQAAQTQAAQTDQDAPKQGPRRARPPVDPRRRRARSAGRRGSVPSWDDILFGGGRGGKD